jgi:hypothetical protein
MNGTGWALVGGTLGVAQGVGLVALGVLCPPVGIAMLVVGVGYGIYDVSSRLDDGQSTGQALGGAAADLTGVNEIYSGLYNQDIATHKDLGLDDYSRGQLFGGGLVQAASLCFAVKAGGSAAYDYFDESGATIGRGIISRMNGTPPTAMVAGDGTSILNVPAAVLNPAAGGSISLGGGGWGWGGSIFGGFLAQTSNGRSWIAGAILDDLADMDPHDRQFYLRPGSNPQHHVATIYEGNNNWASQFRPIFRKAGMTLEDPLNIVEVPGHYGPHPDEYHQVVLRALLSATDGLSGQTYSDALIAQMQALRIRVTTPGDYLNTLITRPR